MFIRLPGKQREREEEEAAEGDGEDTLRSVYARLTLLRTSVCGIITQECMRHFKQQKHTELLVLV